MHQQRTILCAIRNGVRLKRQLVLLAALALTAAGSGAASAATMSLGMDTDEEPGAFRGVDLRPDGSLTIGVRRGYFVQRYLARLTADDGLPVTGCLAPGARLRLVDVKGVVRATAHRCPTAEGTFEMRPVGTLSAQTPTVLTSRLVGTATTEGATPRTVSAVTSNALRIRVEPTIVNETPKSFVGSGRFPVQFRVAAPAVARVGTFTLLTLSGKKWVTAGTFRADRNGRMHTRVSATATVNRFSVVFMPTARSMGWLPSTYSLTIRNQTDTAPPPTAPATQSRTLSLTRG